MKHRFRTLALGLLLLLGCSDSGGRGRLESARVESCMQCHNGSKTDPYAGPGIENPHPFPGAESIACTTCHGGDPEGEDQAASHVPPPPEIGGREQWRTDARAAFNRRTLAGIDKFPDYDVNGRTFSPIDWLQFVNPGDLRVTTRGRGCGLCHGAHSDAVSRSPLATEVGMFSGASFASGVGNEIAAHEDLYEDTAGDLAFRAIGGGDIGSGEVGLVSSLVEVPVYSRRSGTGPSAIRDNPAYDAENVAAGQAADGRAITGSPLANLFREQVSYTCGDCHLGSAGANNRFGDFRSSGCTACHMRYSLDGRSRSLDPNVPKTEPLDPDAIDEPERSHVKAHRIASVRKTLASGAEIEGIDDFTCVGCHQGSNRTVLQYWGIRLDQNEDLRRRRQYPANPVTFRNTSADARLFDPLVGNRTFNGRNANQYIAFEDYDGDGRDDTPADVHHEAGLGCIDCHGSSDLHGEVGRPGAGKIVSRMEQHVLIRCENCHGTVGAYAPTRSGTAWDGAPAQVAMDANGNPLEHVTRDGEGNYFLQGRLTGRRHYIPQTRDTVVDGGKSHPVTGAPIYSARASYAMGRDDGDPLTGIGPRQEGTPPSGFSHTDDLNCAACHSSWTNNCIGCHLKGEYTNGNEFSNITGERIVYRQTNADFVYISPLFFQLGVNPRNKIAQVSPNTKVFYQWEDRHDERTKVFAFSDRNGDGNAPGALGALGHNALLAHSIRGRVTPTNEGPRYCVACHLTEKALADYRPLYDSFRAAMEEGAYDRLEFPTLRLHFGQNPGNRLNSPLWIHMVAGLGTGLFLFDENGAALNPLDTNPDRIGSEGVAPASVFDPLRARFNLDRIVDASGRQFGSSTHAMLLPGALPNRRDGAANPNLAGPLGARLVRRLADPAAGIVLDSWIDADAAPGGGAAAFLGE